MCSCEQLREGFFQGKRPSVSASSILSPQCFCLKHSNPSFSRSRNNSLPPPPSHLWQVRPHKESHYRVLDMYSCSSWSGFSARIRGGWSLKVWVAPDYTLIATLPLASELPLQSASLGFYMCVGHNLRRGAQAELFAVFLLQESSTRNQIQGPNHRSW